MPRVSARQGRRRRRTRPRLSLGRTRGVDDEKFPTLGFPDRYISGNTSSPELKFLTTLTSGVIASSGKIITSLNLIDQGVGDSDRVGRAIHLKTLEIRMTGEIPTLTAGADLDDLNDLVRVVVYQDKQPNGAAAGVTDVLETASITSPFQLFNRRRFRILNDSIVKFTPSSATWNTSSTTFYATSSYAWFSVVLPLNFAVEYSDTGNGISDVAVNNLGLLLVSYIGNAQLNGRSRVMYTDL